jgi:hypothetical protein
MARNISCLWQMECGTIRNYIARREELSGAVQDHHYLKHRRPGHSHQYSDAQMKVRAGCCIRNFVVRHEGSSTDLTRHEIKIAISAAVS